MKPRRVYYCKADGCTVEIPNWKLMCPKHWFRVTPMTRLRVNDRQRQYRIARDVRSPWVREKLQEYTAAVRQAIEEAKS